MKKQLNILEKPLKHQEKLKYVLILVMCYINLNDMKNAKLNLDIAKKLNPEDEIVKEIDKC